MRGVLTFVAVLALLAIATAVLTGITAVMEAQCRDRGGHLEPVWGGRGSGWTCDGARP